MKTQVTTTSAPQKVSALAILAERCQVDPEKLHSTLRNTVFKGASDEELLALVAVANSYNLNPLTKELYAFPAKGGGIVPVVSIDGWVSMVNDHPQMDGMEFEFLHDDSNKLEAVTCRIYRKDRNRPIEVTEYLSECRRNTEPWKMEHRMLRHKALMQCARYAFGFSGVTDEDEAADTPGMRDATPPPVKQQSNKNPYEKKPATIPATADVVEGEESETASDIPPRVEMVKGIRATWKPFDVGVEDAEEAYHAAGLLPADKSLKDLSDKELYQIFIADTDEIFTTADA